MKKVLTKSILLSMVALSLAFVSCNDKPKEQPTDQPAANTPDTALVSAAEKNIKAHQEDIQALWDMTFGQDRKIANYSLANDCVFLSTGDGNDGLLLSFYKDMKDIDNFDGVPVCDGQELSFQGEALVIKANDKTTYFKKTEREGFMELFSVTEKDGKKVYTNDLGEPYAEAEAQDFIGKISNEASTKLSDILNRWKTE